MRPLVAKAALIKSRLPSLAQAPSQTCRLQLNSTAAAAKANPKLVKAMMCEKSMEEMNSIFNWMSKYTQASNMTLREISPIQRTHHAIGPSF
eukprot:801964-Pleurochrysis_carterae.AAC.2